MFPRLGPHVAQPPISPAVPPLVQVESAAFDGEKLKIRAKATSQRDEIRDIRIIVGGLEVGTVRPQTPNLLQRTAEAVVARADWEGRTSAFASSIKAQS